MKILVIQECGEHAGNKEFRECWCYKRAFDALGHECDVWGYNHINYIPDLNSFPDFNTYDLILNLENYSNRHGFDWLPDISQFNKPFKVLLAVDSHVRGTQTYESIYQHGKYDVLAHATKDYVKANHHRWLPNCTDSGLIRPIQNRIKTHLIGFCGNHVTPQRKAILETLTTVFGLKQDIWVIGNEMVNTINSYHIHFNMNIANDINYRSFETLACETVLLTNYNYQYEELGFVHGTNCFFYHDQTDLMRIANELINRVKGGDETLNQVAKNGRDLLTNNHTYVNRAKQVIGFVS